MQQTSSFRSISLTWAIFCNGKSGVHTSLWLFLHGSSFSIGLGRPAAVTHVVLAPRSTPSSEIAFEWIVLSYTATERSNSSVFRQRDLIRKVADGTGEFREARLVKDACQQ